MQSHSGSDPLFFQKYLQRSRLGFIGSWRSWLIPHLQSHLRSLPPDARSASLRTHTGEGPHPDPCSGWPRVYFYADVDCFFAQVMQQQARSRGAVISEEQPVAVAHASSKSSSTASSSSSSSALPEAPDEEQSHDEYSEEEAGPPGEGAAPASPASSRLSAAPGASRSEISSCNYAARALGIRAGMSVGQAQGLCPAHLPLLVLPYDFPALREASQAVFAVLCELAGEGTVQPASCDEALLNASAFAAPGAAAAALRAALRARTGLAVSIGVGPTPFLARMAVRAAKPDGLHIMPGGAAAAAAQLAPLPVGALHGVGREAAAALAQLCPAVHTVGQLAGRGEGELARLLGRERGAELLRMARGESQHGLSGGGSSSSSSGKKPASVSVQCTWGVRFPEGCAVPVQQFLADMCKELGARCREACSGLGAGGLGPAISASEEAGAQEGTLALPQRLEMELRVVPKEVAAAGGATYKGLGHGPGNTLLRAAKELHSSGGSSSSSAGLEDRLCAAVVGLLWQCLGSSYTLPCLRGVKLKAAGLAAKDPAQRGIEGFLVKGGGKRGREEGGQEGQGGQGGQEEQGVIVVEDSEEEAGAASSAAGGTLHSFFKPVAAALPEGLQGESVALQRRLLLQAQQARGGKGRK